MHPPDLPCTTYQLSSTMDTSHAITEMSRQRDCPQRLRTRRPRYDHLQYPRPGVRLGPDQERGVKGLGNVERTGSEGIESVSRTVPFKLSGRPLLFLRRNHQFHHMGGVATADAVGDSYGRVHRRICTGLRQSSQDAYVRLIARSFGSQESDLP